MTYYYITLQYLQYFANGITIANYCMFTQMLITFLTDDVVWDIHQSSVSSEPKRVVIVLFGAKLIPNSVQIR